MNYKIYDVEKEKYVDEIKKPANTDDALLIFLNKIKTEDITDATISVENHGYWNELTYNGKTYRTEFPQQVWTMDNIRLEEYDDMNITFINSSNKEKLLQKFQSIQDKMNEIKSMVEYKISSIGLTITDYGRAHNVTFGCNDILKFYNWKIHEKDFYEKSAEEIAKEITQDIDKILAVRREKQESNKTSLQQKEAELASLESEEKKISAVEALIEQQKEGQDIGEN